MRAIARVVGVTALLAICGVASASAGVNSRAQKPEAATPCAVPRGWKVAAEDSRVLIVKRDVNRTDAQGTRTGWRWRYCLRPSGRLRDLFADVYQDSGLGDVVTHGAVALAGLYVADVSTRGIGGGRYGCYEGITIHNLGMRKARNAFTWHNCDVLLAPLLVDSRGFAGWHMTRYPDVLSNPLTAVSCASESLCVAADEGHFLWSTTPTAGRGAWHFTDVSDTPLAVACPTSGLCVASDGFKLLTSTHPTGGATAWASVPLPKNEDFAGVACASSTACVTVGGDMVISSTNPAGGPKAWRTTRVAGAGGLDSVSCPSTSLCVATDGNGPTGGIFASTNPMAPTSSWRRVVGRPHAYPIVYAVSCPSVSLCVATANDSHGRQEVLTTTEPTGGPTAWKPAIVSGHWAGDVSCGSPSLCVSAGLDGIGSSTNPTGGAAAWHSGQIANVIDLKAVSCPSASLCVAVSDSGFIATSTDPAGGSSTWSSSLVDAPQCVLTTPCESERIYAYDSSGTHWLDSAPPGTGKTLAHLRLRGNLLTWTHGGTARQAQLH